MKKNHLELALIQSRETLLSLLNPVYDGPANHAARTALIYAPVSPEFRADEIRYHEGKVAEYTGKYPALTAAHTEYARTLRDFDAEIRAEEAKAAA